MRDKIIKILVVLLVPFVVLLTSLEIVVKSEGFFLEQYEINNVEQATGMEIQELMRVTGEIQDYLFGNRDDFNITGVINSVEGEIFNEREIVHMEDVRVLFDRGIILRNAGAVLLLFILAYGAFTGKKWLLKSLLYAAVSYFILLVLTAGLLFYDFNRYFNLFHEVFFSNDYWILDPRDSVLINMVPLNFFINIVKRILIISSGAMTAILLFYWIMLKKEVTNERRFNIGN
ncbi:TIGR01906 family membrane protein [Alkalibacter saccharofermentans]|uniref:Integral membrane protein TIGR01906 n=1 Tax=Alkalibacter saccharofermentans DSM 14828 TaxID=1120975 RepID=A0A1M4VBY4_9FIRM|nr:TIGR01906 family membrane protein [Alkalibacter saccharofermentans]SHE66475.1 integral membrane protein TIGR01906 [Alkalibacter saccharofermentans DSM 14828]